MKGAIIGFGVIALGHLNAYKQMGELEIVAVVDICAERRELAYSMIDGVVCYEKFEDLCKHKEIEFIDVCTPPYVRFEYMRKGLEAGYHVIGEKPFLLNLSQYEELFNIAKKNNVILYPSHNYKFAPVMKYLKNVIDEEKFGTIVNGHFKTFRCGNAKGCEEWNTDWRRELKYSGGGIIMDHGPHSIYMTCYFMKKWPEAVSCLSCISNAEKYDTEDTAFLTLYFENDIKIDIFLTWISSVRETHYYIFGSEKSVLVEDDSIRLIGMDGKIEDVNIESDFNDSSHKNWFKDVLGDFYYSVKNNHFRDDLIRESYVTIATIKAAIESCKQGGKKVPISFSHALFDLGEEKNCN